MGQGTSTLIDDLHTSAQMPDELSVKRKIDALKAVQHIAADPVSAVQIIEQGGIQPLLSCYNASHPTVRIEAAKTLALLATQPENQIEMGHDDILPRYHPALLTASYEFCEHAMALLAELASYEPNRMKIAHEGLLGPITNCVTAPREKLQMHALDALAKLCEVPQIAILGTQRNILPMVLRAARSPKEELKLAVVRVLTGIAKCGDNMSAFIQSGAMIFLMGCTYTGHRLQLAVAQCLEGLLKQVYEGSVDLTEKEANMLAIMSAVEVSPERISDDDVMELDMRTAMDMPMVELVPELVHRVKRLINCDRASVFIRSEDGSELTTILADASDQITIPADVHSIAGECAVHNTVINLTKAYERENFNQAIDRKTGYRTRSMLVVPIRKTYNTSKGRKGEEEEEKTAGAVANTSEPPIGVIQCINKLGTSQNAGGEGMDEDGSPIFTSEDERLLEVFTSQITPILEKITYKKRAPRTKFQLGSDWVQNIATLAALDVYTVVKVTLDRMRDLVLADRASLFLHDRKKKQLWSKIADDIAEIRLPANAGIVGAVCTSGEALNIDDAYKDPRFNRRIDTATGYRTRTILCVPMKNQRGEVVGVLQCINKKTGTPFTQEDLANLEEFCWQIAAVLEFKAVSTTGDADAVATGDGIGLLLHLVQESSYPEIQRHAAHCIGFLSRNEANRERVVALGGVPVLLALAMPWPWRSNQLLHGISRSMGNLSMSPAVRQEVSEQGGWKSLLALAQTTDEAVWFDSLRALANLALHEPPQGSTPLAKQLHGEGALEVALNFLSRTPAVADLRVQAVRLAGNLSTCCRDGADKSATASFSRPEVLKRVGDAAIEAALKVQESGQGSEVLIDFASAYSRLSRVPAIACWLFDVTGVGVLEAFAQATGPTADDVRAQLGCILANCLRQRQNQRIVLEMLLSQDPTESSFRNKSTTEQRLLLLKERDALRTGKEVRGLMTRLLRAPSSNPLVFLQYARMLQMLAAEPSNHEFMLHKHDVSSYVEQLVFLASPMQTHGDTVAAALRGLRLLAEAEVVDGVLRTLAGPMKLIPVLLHAAHSSHEDTKIEVCRLVKAFARRPETAIQLVQSKYTPPANGPGGQPAPPPLGDANALTTTEPKKAESKPFLAVRVFAFARDSPLTLLTLFSQQLPSLFAYHRC